MTETLTEPEPIPLAKPEELATLTGLEPAAPALLLALKRASDRFRAAVGYPLSLVEGDRIFLDGDGTDTLLLPAAPVRELSVLVDGAEVTDYSASRRAGIVRRRGAVWPDGLENIEVTYTHGYQFIPGAVQDAVLEQAATQALVHAHIQSESAGGTAATYGAAATIGVTQKWVDAVARYSLRGDRA